MSPGTWCLVTKQLRRRWACSHHGMRACVHAWQQVAGLSREQASEAALAGLGPLEARLEAVEVRWEAAAKQAGAEVAGLSHALAL
eukprot:COSAG01_NODE_41677_length_448_cov_2.017192_1_plen_84_part_10